METVDLKLVLLGQPGVGKTCLVYRYLYNTFGETISVRASPLTLRSAPLVLRQRRLSDGSVARATLADDWRVVCHEKSGDLGAAVQSRHLGYRRPGEIQGASSNLL